MSHKVELMVPLDFSFKQIESFPEFLDLEARAVVIGKHKKGILPKVVEIEDPDVEVKNEQTDGTLMDSDLEDRQQVPLMRTDRKFILMMERFPAATKFEPKEVVEKVKKKMIKLYVTNSLQLEHNLLTTLTCSSLHPFEFQLNRFIFNWRQSLQSINLSFNEFTEIPTKELMLLENLKVLYLHANLINSIDNLHELQSLKNLFSFTLHGNPIEINWATYGGKPPKKAQKLPVTACAMNKMKPILSYKSKIISILPNLKNLDFATITPADIRTSRVMAALLSSFIIYFICDGISYSFGQFFNAFHHGDNNLKMNVTNNVLDSIDNITISNTNGASTALSSMTITVLHGMPLFFSPIATEMLDRVGYSVTSTIGAISLILSFIIVSLLYNWKSSLILTIFAVGTLTSFGLALLYLTGYLIIARHVPLKRLATATGFSVSSGGMGTMLLTPVLNYWLTYFGIAVSSFYISLFTLPVICSVFFIYIAEKSINKNGKKVVKTIRPIERDRSLTFHATHKKESIVILLDHRPRSKTCEGLPNNKEIFPSLSSIEHAFMNSRYASRWALEQEHNQQNKLTNQRKLKVMLHQYFQSIKRIFSTIEVNLLNLSFCFFSAFGTPIYAFLSDALIISNVMPTNTSAWVIACSGVPGIVGLLLLGWIVDFIRSKKLLDSCELFIHGICAIVSGLSIVIFTVILRKNYENHNLSLTIAIFASILIFGFFTSANLNLMNSILEQLVPIDDINRAFGLMQLSQGILILIVTPLIGLLNDNYNSYFISFSVCAIGYFIAGISTIYIWWRKRSSLTITINEEEE
ncbi:hypothetical protein SNEBB_007367 [Seison nebaliae]|nr:hypothetical protein SNEBB_007367 [Seison nebaliae]